MSIRKLFIHGGGSEITKFLIEFFSKDFDEFFIFCRDEIKTKKNININKFEEKKFFFYENDLRNLEITLNDIKKLPKDLNSVIWVSGFTGNPDLEYNDPNLISDNINVNYLNIIISLTELTKKIKVDQNNFIAVFTAVAGIRGRQKKLYYGSAKAGLINFLSALRQKFHNKIDIITILPGYINTEAFQKLKLQTNKLLITSPKDCASIIYRGIKKRRFIIFVNSYWRIVMFIVKAIPEKFFKHLKF